MNNNFNQVFEAIKKVSHIMALFPLIYRMNLAFRGAGGGGTYIASVFLFY